MGEQAAKTGKKLEDFGEVFFSGLGWVELTRDKEIQLFQKAANMVFYKIWEEQKNTAMLNALSQEE